MTILPAEFEKQVIHRSATVRAGGFPAPWRIRAVLGPVLERLAEQANGRWELVKVNTEENEKPAAAFNLTGIPAVKLFVNARWRTNSRRAPEPQVRRFLERALPSTHREAVIWGGGAGTGSNATRPRSWNRWWRRSPETEARVLLAQALLPMIGACRGVARKIPSHADGRSRRRPPCPRQLVRTPTIETMPPPKARDQYLAAAMRCAGDMASALDALIGH
jgi:thioredoxin-like negative regulator of GroEL